MRKLWREAKELQHRTLIAKARVLEIELIEILAQALDEVNDGSDRNTRKLSSIYSFTRALRGALERDTLKPQS